MNIHVDASIPDIDPHAVIRAVAAKIKFDTSGHADKARQLAEAYAVCQDDLNCCTAKKARAPRELEELQAKAATGELDELPSREELLARYERQRRATKARFIGLHDECYEHANPVIEDLSKAVLNYADNLESEQLKQFDDHAVPPEPSKIVRAIRQAVGQVLRPIPQVGLYTPPHNVYFWIEDLPAPVAP